ACRAYANVVWTLLDFFRLDEAGQYLRSGLKLAEKEECFGFLVYLRTEQARLALARGQWSEATRYAGLATDLVTGSHRPSQMAALTVRSIAAVRRGQPAAPGLLDQASEVAARMPQIQR